jgi:hypothetical protein
MSAIGVKGWGSGRAVALRIGVAGRRGATAVLVLVTLASLALLVPDRSTAHPVGEHADSAGPLPLAGTTLPRLAGDADADAIAQCTGPSPNQGSVPIDEDLAITGSFAQELEGSYVMLPFEVPEGTDAIRIKYCHDQPLVEDPEGLNRHTIDIGLYGPRSGGEGLWGRDEFRGWGGSSRKDVTVSPKGTLDPDPNPVAGQETTVGFIPEPVPPGRWAVELGAAAIAAEAPLEDGEVQWRVEIELIDDPAFSDEPYEQRGYDQTPARGEPGWYAGDLHVHARHSAPGDATMRETFDFAFCPDADLGPRCDDPDARPGAGLDFIALSDYVGTRQWGEIGAFQADYPGRLIMRSAEVITYRGHANNHASAAFADYRTGPIHVAQLRGGGAERTIAPVDASSPARPARPASAIFDEILAAGGWTQINHPTTFPSEVPTFGNLCRGCSWDFSAAETDYSKVDAIEVATGPAGLQEGPRPGPNPFTPLAIRFWEDAIDSEGKNSSKIAAVGSSDSHHAGRSPNPITQSPIGQATTVVRASELSERGIQEGVKAGHTYVKMWGNDGPDLRLKATVPGSGDPPAIIGDTVEADDVRFEATVANLAEARAARGGLYALFVVRDGLPLLGPIPLIAGDEQTFEFDSIGPGRYRLQVDRTAQGVASIEAVSSHIFHEPPGATPPEPRCPRGGEGLERNESGQGTARSRGQRGTECGGGERARPPRSGQPPR